MDFKIGLSLKYLKNDLPAGLVVFLVALPLCLGIALASGAPLFSGIISGIVGGTIVAFASGSQLSVSGPAAGLTVIVLNALQQIGSYEAFLLAVVLAGVLQILLGYLKAGIIGNYFPSNVIKGMLAAIGIILVLKQIPHAVGYDSDNEGDFYFFQLDGENTISEIFKSLNYIHPSALLITIVSLFILILWERPFLKNYSFFRTIPGALIVVVLGILTNEYLKSHMSTYALDGTKLVQLPVAGSVNEFVGQFTLPDFTAFSNYHVYVVAVTIAIIASLESLLSVEAADKLDPYKRNTPTNRELKAQGLGNLVSGLIGGIPLTAVIVRSSANINAGGKTKLSAIIHGLFLLISVIGLSTLLNKIPLASLAAVLLMVGYKLAKVSLFKSMYRLGWDQFLPFIVTIIAIQFSDLLKGIGVGMAVSVFFILRNNLRTPYVILHGKNEKGNELTIQFSGDVTFLNKGSIINELEKIEGNSTVIVDGSNAKSIDIDVIEIIHDFKQTAELKKINYTLVNIPEFKGVSGH